VLVIDDEAAILRALRINLSARNYTVTTASDGASGLSAMARDRPDAVILDLGLPDMDGTDVIRGIRGWSSAPIIVLSANGQELQKVQALDAGADDYVTKPFRVAELVARLRARLRGAAGRALAAETSEQPGTAGVRVDLESHRAWLGGRQLELTPKEFDLLALFVGEAGRALRREKIMSTVWDEHWWGSTRTLDMHISALRRKLGDDPTHPRLITTVRGIGFRFEPGSAEPD
jgi:DNA-binding response OmpR family regulator